MKVKLLVTLFLLVVSASIVSAQDRGFGLGVIIGEPTGFSAKYWIDDKNAFDYALGYSLFEENSTVSFHTNYLYHLHNVIDAPVRIPLYYGFGVRFRARENSESGLGVRGVIGAVWLSDYEPFDVFFEIAPVFQLFPDTELKLDVGLGGRYYFY